MVARACTQGTGGRGGYFDSSGIIRDVMQTHLMQIFLWLAMEQPTSMAPADVMRAKVDLLRRVPALSLDPGSAFLGQYAASGDEPGYLDDESVPPGSLCPTFASVLLRVHNERWDGVPFLFTAGKGMDERVCEVRVRYRPRLASAVPGAGAGLRLAGWGGDGASSDDSRNELVMRIQPDVRGSPRDPCSTRWADAHAYLRLCSPGSGSAGWLG